MNRNIVFITFYDTICIGLRLLSAISKKYGFNPHIIFVKKESYFPIIKEKNEYKSYQFIYNGLRWGSCYAASSITEKEKNLLIQQIDELKPAFIGLSTRTFAKEICREIFPKVKNNFPEIPLIGGGWGPTLEPEVFLEFCDYVCFGEGEATIQHLCSAVCEGRKFSEVPNLIYYNNEKLTHNQYLPPLTVEEINSLPHPDYSTLNNCLIDKDRIWEGKEFNNNSVYDIFAARGCPLNCSYCLSSKYSMLYKEKTGIKCPKYRLKDFHVFMDELRTAKKLGARYIRIKDEVFPIRPSWIDKFIDMYSKEIGLPFFAYIRPEFHHPDTLKKLKEAGLKVTVVGIQSGCENTLKDIYFRKLSKPKIVNFSKTLKDLNIDFFYHFIYGNPFETEKHLVESYEFTFQLPFAKSMFFKLEPHPLTPISKMIDEQKPVGVDPKISEWFAMLHSLSLMNRPLRKISGWIYKKRIFQSHPRFLSVLFIPYIVKETIDYINKKIKLKAHSVNVVPD